MTLCCRYRELNERNLEGGGGGIKDLCRGGAQDRWHARTDCSHLKLLCLESGLDVPIGFTDVSKYLWQLCLKTITQQEKKGNSSEFRDNINVFEVSILLQLWQIFFCIVAFIWVKQIMKKKICRLRTWFNLMETDLNMSLQWLLRKRQRLEESSLID